MSHINNAPTPDIQTIKECLKYNRKDGTLIWRTRPRHHFKDKNIWTRFNTLYAGKVAGTLQNEGYLHVQINHKKILAHRIVWLLLKGRWPKKLIDHADGDGTNNRANNIREADVYQNRMNSVSKVNASGYKNVYAHSSGKWVAMIKHRGRHIYGGLFDSAEEAAKKAKELRIKFHGKFANHAFLKK
jgi:hypothetical protein